MNGLILLMNSDSSAARSTAFDSARASSQAKGERPALGRRATVAASGGRDKPTQDDERQAAIGDTIL